MNGFVRAVNDGEEHVDDDQGEEEREDGEQDGAQQPVLHTDVVRELHAADRGAEQRQERGGDGGELANVRAERHPERLREPGQYDERHDGQGGQVQARAPDGLLQNAHRRRQPLDEDERFAPGQQDVDAEDVVHDVDRVGVPLPVDVRVGGQPPRQFVGAHHLDDAAGQRAQEQCNVGDVDEDPGRAPDAPAQHARVLERHPGHVGEGDQEGDLDAGDGRVAGRPSVQDRLDDPELGVRPDGPVGGRVDRQGDGAEQVDGRIVQGEPQAHRLRLHVDPGGIAQGGQRAARRRRVVRQQDRVPAGQGRRLGRQQVPVDVALERHRPVQERVADARVGRRPERQHRHGRRVQAGRHALADRERPLGAGRQLRANLVQEDRAEQDAALVGQDGLAAVGRQARRQGPLQERPGGVDAGDQVERDALRPVGRPAGRRRREPPAKERGPRHGHRLVRPAPDDDREQDDEGDVRADEPHRGRRRRDGGRRRRRRRRVDDAGRGQLIPGAPGQDRPDERLLAGRRRRRRQVPAAPARLGRVHRALPVQHLCHVQQRHGQLGRRRRRPRVAIATTGGARGRPARRMFAIVVPGRPAAHYRL